MASDPRKEIQQRMEALVRSGAGVVLELWLQEQLDTRTKATLECSKEMFEVHKGRCHELRQLILTIQKMRESKP